MFRFILKEEFIFYIEKKKNYLFQTFMNYLERMIFLAGMLLLLCTDDTLLLSSILKVTFWFLIVNSILEITQRIENEIRLKQFDKCFNTKISYWYILFLRFIPLLIDSLIICILSILIIHLFIPIIIDIFLFHICVYIVLMLFQYFIFLYIFSFIGIYFQRVQAIIGIVESYAFFYSGIVISSTKFSIPIFSFIQNITNHQYQSLPILLISMLIELIVVYIGTIWITKHIKSM